MELCLCYRNCTAYFRNIDDLVKHKIEIHGYNQLRCGIDGCNYTCKLMVEIQNMMRTCHEIYRCESRAGERRKARRRCFEKYPCVPNIASPEV